MKENPQQRSERHGHLRHMAQALAVQVHPDNYSREEALEIERLFHEQIRWLYDQEERDLRVVG